MTGSNKKSTPDRHNRFSGLKTLKTLNLDSSTNKKLKSQARQWIKFIEFHINDMHRGKYSSGNSFILYHKGEIAFIEFFFNIKHTDTMIKHLKGKSKAKASKRKSNK
jgi:hypothetical protein